MSFVSVSLWDATEWTDEMEATAREKYIPMVMGLGAESVAMVRTGDLSFIVVTKYPDEATAEAAQARVAEVRAEAADEFPMSLSGVHAGVVFASG